MLYAFLCGLPTWPLEAQVVVSHPHVATMHGRHVVSVLFLSTLPASARTTLGNGPRATSVERSAFLNSLVVFCLFLFRDLRTRTGACIADWF